MAHSLQCEAIKAHRPSLKPAKLFSFSGYIAFTLSALLTFLLFMYFGSHDGMLTRSQSSFRQRLLRHSVPQSIAPSSSNQESTPAFILPESIKTQPNGDSLSPAPEPPISKDSQDQCDGRRIFIYKLPAEFNELIGKECKNWSLPFWSMCDDLSNYGFGDPMNLSVSEPEAALLQPPSAWFKTDQFSLEVIFHRRLVTYPCLTKDPEKASLFYAPFYHALDVTRHLYNDDLTLRDHLSRRFVAWLRNQRPWQRHHGHRHVVVLGRIIWDFLRRESVGETWGSALLTHPELFNATKLLIERFPWRDPWMGDTVAIPYPTNFHPSSDADLQSWQSTVRSANRTQFVSYAGSSRGRNMTGMVRGEIFRQCGKSPKCKHLMCTQKLCGQSAQTVYKLSLESVFCLQPAGDSYTRKGIFDTLVAGCIPVLFDAKQAVGQYLWHLPGDGRSYSVLMDGDAVTMGHYDVIQRLERIPKAEVERMQECIVQLLPTLVYRNPAVGGEYTSRDAFDVAIDSVLAKLDGEDRRLGRVIPGSAGSAS